MTVALGVDSAFGPTITQAEQAYRQGIDWWGWYAGGPGAYHIWTDSEVAVLAAAGIWLSLPIWVPKLDLTGDPHADYRTVRGRVVALGWTPVVALDTEASMRGNPRLHSYVDGWNAEAATHGDPQVVYGGGNYVGTAHPWWIITSTPPAGQAHQTGQSTLAGLSVDLDQADSAFPLASLHGTPRPTPPPTPPQPPAVTNYPEDHMHSTRTVVGPFDSNGDGYFDQADEPDADKIINVVVTGIANPPDVGGYPPIPHIGVREQNGIARIVLEGGAAGASYRVNVWEAD